MNRRYNHSTYPNFLTDYGPSPFVVNIEQAAMQNCNYRTALWTGSLLQLTLMCIPVGGDIGLEVHPDTDQFIRIELGTGTTVMGTSKDCMKLCHPLHCGSAVFVPAGTWHNIVNTGNQPLKLYTIYAPVEHPRGIVQRTKP